MKRADVIATAFALMARSGFAGWIPAATISDPNDFGTLPQVALDKRRAAIAVWRGFDGTNYRIRAAIRPAGGAFGTVQTLSDPNGDAGAVNAGPQVAVDKKGNAVAMWHRFDGANDRIEAAVRPAAGAFGGAQPVSDAGSDARFPVLAFDGKRNAIALWIGPQLAFDPKRNAVAVWGSYSGMINTIHAALYTR